MSVTIEQVRHIAKLAKLRFSAEEELEMVDQLNRILSYMDKLNELNTDDVEPLYHLFDPGDAEREDVVEERITHQEAMKNAPDTDGTFFRVPKVIG